jgi:hypothetical protein
MPGTLNGATTVVDRQARGQHRGQHGGEKQSQQQRQAAGQRVEHGPAGEPGEGEQPGRQARFAQGMNPLIR